MKKNSGFTLLELLITLALISVLVAVAIPSMRAFSQNDRLTTNINTMIGHLAYARSEAVKRHAQVSLCVSNDTVGCTGGNWEDGWIIYVDADANGTYDAATVNEDILRVQQTLDGNNAFTPSAAYGNQVTYDNRGFVTATGSFLLCDNRSGDFGKTITISNTGRVRFQDESTC
ncbi:MAG: GspH/FimT family protein [Gammaproteobacteria bacterium]|nr:GspH/FimT family protein [Gammaproteobacteria bacterium]